MKHVNSTKTSKIRSDVEDPPESRDEGCRKTRRSTNRYTERDHPMFTEVHKSTEPRRQSITDLSLSP
jgi:hypothetical protein